MTDLLLPTLSLQSAKPTLQTQICVFEISWLLPSNHTHTATLSNHTDIVSCHLLGLSLGGREGRPVIKGLLVQFPGSANRVWMGECDKYCKALWAVSRLEVAWGSWWAELGINVTYIGMFKTARKMQCVAFVIQNFEAQNHFIPACWGAYFQPLLLLIYHIWTHECYWLKLYRA